MQISSNNKGGEKKKIKKYAFKNQKMFWQSWEEDLNVAMKWDLKLSELYNDLALRKLYNNLAVNPGTDYRC